MIEGRKYKFEERLGQNLMSMEVVDARRFARAVRDAVDNLEREAKCYGLSKEDFYLDTKAFLEQMAARLEAKTYNEDALKRENFAKPAINVEDLDARQHYAILQNAKDLLRYLNDTYQDFPCVTYLDGSTSLQQAMQFVDEQILQEN